MSLPSARARRWAVAFGMAPALALSLLVAGCGEEDGDAGPTIDQMTERGPETPIVIAPGEPIIVGVSAALSGPDEMLGTDSRDAAIVGVERWKEANGEQIGGHDIEVHAEDDGCSDADITSVAAGRLLYGRGGHDLLRGLVGVIGPMCSAGASRVIPVYGRAGIVMISGSATRSDLSRGQGEPGFFFRTAYTNSQEGALQARYAAQGLGASSAWLVDDSEAYGTDLANAVRADLRGAGVEVTRESIERGAVDFSDLAARVTADGPDVIIFEGFNPEGALLYRQLRDAGYDGAFLSSDGVVSKSDFIEPLNAQAEGAMFAGCAAALPQAFLDDYIERIGHPPTTPFPAQYADAATVLLDAVAKAAVEQGDGSLVIQPLALRQAVSETNLESGVSGPVTFDENGDRVGQGADIGLVMCSVQGGEFVNVPF